MISNYLLENGRIAIKHTRHGFMAFNRNDTVIGRSLDLYGEWCEDELRFLSGAIRYGDLVVDVGSNIGTHALGFSQLVGNQGTVIACEPQPQTFNILCANVAMNVADNVRCFNKAVSNIIGTISVPRLAPDAPANFGGLGLRGNYSGPTDLIEMVAIDDLQLPSCRLIKADVQGMEPEVLRSAARTISSYRPYLYVECDQIDYGPELIGTIMAFGYDIWWHLTSHYSPFNLYGNPHNLFHHFSPSTNLFCAPSEQNLSPAGLDRCLGIEDTFLKAIERANFR